MFSIEFQMFSNEKGKKKSFFLLIAHTVNVGNKKQNTKKGSPILLGNHVPSWFASWQWENRVLSTNVDIHNSFIMNVQTNVVQNSTSRESSKFLKKSLQRCILSMILPQEKMQGSPDSTSVLKLALCYRTSFRTWFYPLAKTSDLKQAFLPICT